MNNKSKINDNINSLIMEQASDTATVLAQKDWGETRKGFYIEEEDGTNRMSEEAQDIFNDYYDQQMEQLERLVSECINQITTP